MANNKLRRRTFQAEDLARVPEADVILASGGPLMWIEAEEGDNVLCRWENEDGSKGRGLFARSSLRRLVQMEPQEISDGE